MIDTTALKAKVQEIQTSFSAALTRVQQDVQFLKDKVAAGEAIVQADIDGVVSGLSSLKASIDGLDPVPENPAPPTPPPA